MADRKQEKERKNKIDIFVAELLNCTKVHRQTLKVALLSESLWLDYASRFMSALLYIPYVQAAIFLYIYKELLCDHIVL